MVCFVNPLSAVLVSVFIPFIVVLKFESKLVSPHQLKDRPLLRRRGRWDKWHLRKQSIIWNSSFMSACSCFSHWLPIIMHFAFHWSNECINWDSCCLPFPHISWIWINACCSTCIYISVFHWLYVNNVCTDDTNARLAGFFYVIMDGFISSIVYQKMCVSWTFSISFHVCVPIIYWWSFFITQVMKLNGSFNQNNCNEKIKLTQM